MSIGFLQQRNQQRNHLCNPPYFGVVVHVRNRINTPLVRLVHVWGGAVRFSGSLCTHKHYRHIRFSELISNSAAAEVSPLTNTYSFSRFRFVPPDMLLKKNVFCYCLRVLFIVVFQRATCFPQCCGRCQYAAQ